jgi:hypothetical protein
MMSQPLVPRQVITQPLDPSYRLIGLTQNQITIVDTADFEWLSQWLWFAQWNSCTKSFYANRNTRGPNRRMVSMHRELLGCGPGELGDHCDGNTLDNRRQNIRRCTRPQNAFNRRIRCDNQAGYKGVYPVRNKWRAAIEHPGGREHLGYFRDPREAARAYDAAAKRLFGSFARLNFPQASSQ